MTEAVQDWNAVASRPMWAVSDLILDGDNVRGHTEENIAAIKSSLTRFKQQKPIVITAEGVVKAGNGTVIAAMELGWDEIWCHVTDLEDEEADAFAIADNRSSELAYWKDELLSIRLDELYHHDIDLFLATGFTEDYRKQLEEGSHLDLGLDAEEMGFAGGDQYGDASVILTIEIPQEQKGTVARQQIQAICDEHNLLLEARLNKR